MKRIFTIITVAALFSMTVNAQQMTEKWNGKMQAGPQSLRIGFNIMTAEDGTRTCTMDVPQQSAKGVPVEIVKYSQDSLVLSIPMLRASYRGGRTASGDIRGQFSQNGMVLALDLAPGGLEASVRPQTPVPPYPYRTEEVEFRNEAAGAVLSGTLTYPADAGGKVPVVLMVTGSGLQNRDEELFEHKPFLVIADYLARHGIASLRYDDRGAGKSSGPVEGTTTMDNLSDALSGVSYLRSLGQFGKIGLLGHSEGGTIAFMAGAEGAVDFIVSLAGTAVKGIDVILGQNEAAMSLGGALSPEMVSQYISALRKICEDRVAGAVAEEPRRYVDDLCKANGWNLTDVLSDNLAACVTSGGEWLTWFLNYDPSEAIRRVECPVMALNGDLDIQVLSKDNLPVLRANLPENGSNVIKEYASLNHLFQHCTPATSLLYGQIDETFSEEVLADIAAWINSLE